MVLLVILIGVVAIWWYLKEQDKKELIQRAQASWEQHEELKELYYAEFAKYKSYIEEGFGLGGGDDYEDDINYINGVRNDLRTLERINWFVGSVLCGDFPRLDSKEVLNLYYNYTTALLWYMRCMRDGFIENIGTWQLKADASKSQLLLIMGPYEHKIPKDIGFYTSEEYNYYRNTGLYYTPRKAEQGNANGNK